MSLLNKEKIVRNNKRCLQEAILRKKMNYNGVIMDMLNRMVARNWVTIVEF